MAKCVYLYNNPKQKGSGTYIRKTDDEAADLVRQGLGIYAPKSKYKDQMRKMAMSENSD